MTTGQTLHIAGIRCALAGSDGVLAELAELYAELEAREAAYKADARNPQLCYAGCSACCKKGAFFAVSLAEALRLAIAVEALTEAARARVRGEAQRLHDLQREVFAQVPGAADHPGLRDEALFAARVTAVTRRGVACPLLAGDLCGVYDGRPLLCRAYGYPVDAYALRHDDALMFRSLCAYYEGAELHDYVRAEDLKARLGELSRRLGSGHDHGRFTSAEAILAEVDPPREKP